MHGSIDGEIVPLDRLAVPVTDRGFLLGDAVYETLRTYDGRLFALDAHLDRLTASMNAIGLRDAPDRDRLAQWLRATTAATVAALRGAETAPSEAVVRVTVTRGSGPHGISPHGAGPPRTVILARALLPAPARLWQDGLRVVTASLRRAPHDVQDPRIKATSALALILARQEADAAGADEALLRDADGRYLEATAANLVAIQGDTYSTPRGEDGVLEGVTSQYVTALLDAAGLRGERAPIPPETLRRADEVLLTQTTREVLPVVQVDGERIGDGRPGPLVARLRRDFRAAVERHLEPAAPD